MSFKRTHRRDYIDGFLTANTLRELCFYNKVRELSESLGSLYVKQVYNFSGENIIRGELRFLRHSEVKKNGFDYLRDIPNQWNLLKVAYSDYMKQVFKYDFNGGEEMSEKVLDKVLIAKLGKEAFKYFTYKPLYEMSKQEIKELLKPHYTRKQVYNILQEVDKKKQRYSKVLTNVNFKSLYSELKEKFLNN